MRYPFTAIEPGDYVVFETTSGPVKGTVQRVDGEPESGDSLEVVHRLEGETDTNTRFVAEKVNTGRLRVRRGQSYNPFANVRQYNVR